MRAELIRIGNWRGIRIPKPLIEECRLGNQVEIRVENDRLVISAEHQPRQSWEEKFRAAGESTGDERLLEAVPPNKFDRQEWNW